MGILRELWRDFDGWAVRNFLRHKRSRGRSVPVFSASAPQERPAEVEQPVLPQTNKINSGGLDMAKRGKKGKLVKFKTTEGKTVSFKTGKPEPEPVKAKEKVTTEELAPAKPEPKVTESSPAPAPTPPPMIKLADFPKLSHRKMMRVTPKRPRLS